MTDPLRAGRVRGLLKNLTPPAAQAGEEDTEGLTSAPTTPDAVKRKKAKKRKPVAKPVEDDELFVVPPEVVS